LNSVQSNSTLSLSLLCFIFTVSQFYTCPDYTFYYGGNQFRCSHLIVSLCKIFLNSIYCDNLDRQFCSSIYFVLAFHHLEAPYFNRTGDLNIQGHRTNICEFFIWVVFIIFIFSVFYMYVLLFYVGFLLTLLSLFVLQGTTLFNKAFNKIKLSCCHTQNPEY
jgi:hypothetical protein